MGMKGEDKDFIPDGNNKSSLQFNDYNTTLESEDGGKDDLVLTTSQRDLCKFFGEGQEEEQVESQEEQAPGDPPEEVPVVEEVGEGDEEANESDEVRQEERVAGEEAMGQDEVAEGTTGGGHSASFENVTSVAGGQEPETPPVASAGGRPRDTQENRHNTTSAVAMGNDERTAVSSSNAKSKGMPK